MPQINVHFQPEYAGVEFVVLEAESVGCEEEGVASVAIRVKGLITFFPWLPHPINHAEICLLHLLFRFVLIKLGLLEFFIILIFLRFIFLTLLFFQKVLLLFLDELGVFELVSEEYFWGPHVVFIFCVDLVFLDPFIFSHFCLTFRFYRNVFLFFKFVIIIKVFFFWLEFCAKLQSLYSSDFLLFGQVFNFFMDKELECLLAWSLLTFCRSFVLHFSGVLFDWWVLVFLPIICFMG